MIIFLLRNRSEFVFEDKLPDPEFLNNKSIQQDFNKHLFVKNFNKESWKATKLQPPPKLTFYLLVNYKAYGW